ncbi:N-acetylmuramoyl-L-alanine amidase [Prolixibacteraceae bacterium JC049]|nr:N-acetylmuramoyl-L-alanine amidase [Prolixibacteraceae bacterium JC049]
MNIYLKYTFLVFVNILLALTSSFAQNNLSNTLNSVVIDAGHGGRDPGAKIGRTTEKRIVLDIALKLGQLIEREFPEVNVIYTRKNDTFVPLYKRVTIANRANAQLFLSIHANYCGTPSVYGTETFVLGNHKSADNLRVAKKENAAILLEKDHSVRYEGFDPNDPVSYVIFELLQSRFQEQSINLAAIMQKHLKLDARRRDRGVKQAGFLVLKNISMPGALLEVGFMSNPSELRYLGSSSNRSRVAKAIFNGFKQYKKAFDARSNYGKEEKKVVQKSTTPIKTTTHTYSIQLAASRKKIALKSYNFKGLKKLYRYKSRKVYKYCFGKYNSITLANSELSHVKRKYKDAFIVEVNNGIVSLPKK